MAKRFPLRLSDSEHEKISVIAERQERSMNDCIREAIREWLDKNRED